MDFPKVKYIFEIKIHIHNTLNYKLTIGWLKRALSYLEAGCKLALRAHMAAT
jgi:hypothetical protein